MARYRGSVCKLCRREGDKLFLKGERCLTAKCSFEKRGYPPGQHGKTRRMGKFSNYGQQLREKQKIKRYYGLLEAQFREIFENATNMFYSHTSEHVITFISPQVKKILGY